MQVAHHQVDGAARSPTHKAAVGVGLYTERQTGVAVGMKWTKTFVMLYAKSKSLGDPLNRQVAELLQLYLIHNFTIHYSLFFLPLQV